ncbi:TetR/AcrR family transcriptional regulator [Streptomyces sp. NPDC059193]|uniref:TetR/AcrR family transcriptional regulator n=1 Tax=Streptomyces sp. NPDC059193 TaxID=3346763 RepID=UPI0036BE42DB
MVQRPVRSDAQRNRQAILAAARVLLTSSSCPQGVSMEDIAVAAGVGKGTLFRRFGDRAGLIRAVVDSLLDPLDQAVVKALDAAGSSPRKRVLTLLDTWLCFKIDNRSLFEATENAGFGSPYQATHYSNAHRLLRADLKRLREISDPDFTAHALLAAIRIDLVTHLLDERNVPPECLRSSLVRHVETLCGTDSV